MSIRVEVDDDAEANRPWEHQVTCGKNCHVAHIILSVLPPSSVTVSFFLPLTAGAVLASTPSLA
jgi:hypothetical protein